MGPRLESWCVLTYGPIARTWLMLLMSGEADRHAPPILCRIARPLPGHFPDEPNIDATSDGSPESRTVGHSAPVAPSAGGVPSTPDRAVRSTAAEPEAAGDATCESRSRRGVPGTP
jgi:hypothetical protein